MIIKCNQCGENKERTKRSASKCNECLNKNWQAWFKKWRLKNPDKIAAYREQSNGRLKKMCVENYGKKCVCCGGTNRLCLDHVNNDGDEHRKEIGAQTCNLLVWAHRNGFPRSLQLLCFACNIMKGHIVRNIPQYFAKPELVQQHSYWCVVNPRGERMTKRVKDKKVAERQFQQIKFFQENLDKLGVLKIICG